jgi:hypothetical protein
MRLLKRVAPDVLLPRLQIQWTERELESLAELVSAAEAFRIGLRVADEVGCRCIVTDAYRDRTDWYARYGFVSIEGGARAGPQRMFLDLRTVRAALRR